jgi:hypothetical protein
MPVRQECPGCKAVLLVPENGKGRCPRCGSIVQAPRSSLPAPPVLEPIVPEIGAEHEVGPAEMRISAEPPPLPVFEAAPVPRARRPRRRQDDEAGFEIAKPLPKSSKTLPLTLLILGFVASILATIGSTIYLMVQAKNHRPVPVLRR